MIADVDFSDVCRRRPAISFRLLLYNAARAGLSEVGGGFVKYLKIAARELGYLALLLGLVLVALPVLIILSVALFDTASEGIATAESFLRGLQAGLAEGQSSSWIILLGPYGIFTALRLVGGVWRALREKTRRRRVENAS